jgi:hypothetical protein
MSDTKASIQAMGIIKKKNKIIDVGNIFLRV